jgi:hypothetical protein
MEKPTLLQNPREPVTIQGPVKPEVNPRPMSGPHGGSFGGHVDWYNDRPEPSAGIIAIIKPKL